MAAPCTRLARSVLLKGVHFVAGGLPWAQGCHNTIVPVCLRFKAAQCRPHHLSPGPALSTSAKVDPQRNTESQKDDKKAKEEEEDEENEGPEYIPRRKAKNPMMKIGYAWMIGLPTGIIGFILAKREVDKNRLKQLKIRQRMKRSNEGEYEGSRYHHRAEEVKLDQ
ncbi:uncharacterized protein ACJ7VT_017009 [Polymixia lowei]